MAKTFSQMKTNVANMLMWKAANSDRQTIVGRWLNDAYQDAVKRIMFAGFINDAYTFETVVGQHEYDLPADFYEELYVADIADGRGLGRQTIGEYWRFWNSTYNADSISSGSPKTYTIIEEDSTIRLTPPADKAETYAMPYRRKPQDMLDVTGTADTDTENKLIASGSTFITSGVERGMKIKNTTDNTWGTVSSVDSETQLTMEADTFPDGDETFSVNPQPIIDGLDIYLENYAIGMGWLFDRQFQKAQFYLDRAEFELQKRASQEMTKINQRYRLDPSISRKTLFEPFTGGTPYDYI